MSETKKRILILASGQGSTFAALAEACQNQRLSAEIVALILSRDGVGALNEAHRQKIPAVVFDPKAFASFEQWDVQLAEALTALNPEWIILAGYTQKLGPKVLKQFPGRIINTHPSLLPKYGGQGMYGLKVHEAVISNQETETGVSVHFVAEEYDTGPVIAQKVVEVRPGDTPTSLQQRLKEVEKEFLLETLVKLIK